MANPEIGLTQHRRPFPFEDRLILEEHVVEKTAGGIIIPEHTREEIKARGQTELKIDIGTVLAVGKGAFTDAGVQVPLPFKPGDTVAYARHSVLEYRLDGETYLIATLSSIIARLDDAPYPKPE